MLYVPLEYRFSVYWVQAATDAALARVHAANNDGDFPGGVEKFDGPHVRPRAKACMTAAASLRRGSLWPQKTAILLVSVSFIGTSAAHLRSNGAGADITSVTSNFAIHSKP